MPQGGKKPSVLHIGARSDPDYQKKYGKLRRAAGNEYNKHYQREYYKKYPERYTYWQIKRKCQLNNIPFDLIIDDLKFPSVCPVLGIPLFRNIGKNQPSGNSPSVDRINPKGGYVKNNIQVISQKANAMKSNASVEELQRFADWVNRTYPR